MPWTRLQRSLLTVILVLASTCIFAGLQKAAYGRISILDTVNYGARELAWRGIGLRTNWNALQTNSPRRSATATAGQEDGVGCISGADGVQPPIALESLGQQLHGGGVCRSELGRRRNSLISQAQMLRLCTSCHRTARILYRARAFVGLHSADGKNPERRCERCLSSRCFRLFVAYSVGRATVRI